MQWDQSNPWVGDCVHTITQLQALLGRQPCSPLLSMLGTSTTVQWFLGMLTPFLGPGLPIRVRGEGPQSLGGTHLIPTVLGEHQR